MCRERLEPRVFASYEGFPMQRTMGVLALSLHRVYRLSDMILQTKLSKLRPGPTKSYIYTPPWVLTES